MIKEYHIKNQNPLKINLVEVLERKHFNTNNNYQIKKFKYPTTKSIIHRNHNSNHNNHYDKYHSNKKHNQI